MPRIYGAGICFGCYEVLVKHILTPMRKRCNKFDMILYAILALELVLFYHQEFYFCLEIGHGFHKMAEAHIFSRYIKLKF